VVPLAALAAALEHQFASFDAFPEPFLERFGDRLEEHV
jgi:hypothetical protein